MKIAINTRFLLSGRLEGIGQFTAEIFKRLSQQHSEIEWVFIFDRKPSPEFQFGKNVRMVSLFPPTRHAFLWHLWFQISLKRFLKKEKPDLFISPDGFIPLNTAIKSLAIMHDLNFVHQPSNLPPIAGAYMRYYFPKYAASASRLATVSGFCRIDIAQTYSVSPDKIDLVYNGVNPQLRASSEEEKLEIRNRYTQGNNFFIFVGALNPRKNLEGMLAGYEQYRESGGKAHFIFVGEEMLLRSDMKNAFENSAYRSEIHFVGRVKTQELSSLIGSAQALCLCSHFEGFGIPILEAFQCKTALICADNSAMPEVAGEAALYCNSRDFGSISAAMLRTEDPQTRDSLIQQGKERLKNFSWDRSAEMMWNSIQLTLGNGPTSEL